MKKHDRNGQKNNHEVKKPVSDSEAKALESVAEAAEAAEDVDVDVASLVNSVAQENVKASEVKAADGLPAELASALAEPRPEIKVGEAEIEEASVEEPAFEETVAEEASVEEPAFEETVAEEASVEETAVEETAASETEETVTETAAG